MEFISNFNGLELIFIIILAILLFGPEKIPEIASKLGSWVRTIRNLSSQVMENLQDETGLSEITEQGTSLKEELQQTAADMDSSARSLSARAAEKTQPRTPESSTREKEPLADEVKKRDLLEDRLRILENELQEIRGELAKEELDQSPGSND